MWCKIEEIVYLCGGLRRRIVALPQMNGVEVQ